MKLQSPIVASIAQNLDLSLLPGFKALSQDCHGPAFDPGFILGAVHHAARGPDSAGLASRTSPEWIIPGFPQLLFLRNHFLPLEITFTSSWEPELPLSTSQSAGSPVKVPQDVPQWGGSSRTRIQNSSTTMSEHSWPDMCSHSMDPEFLVTKSSETLVKIQIWGHTPGWSRTGNLLLQRLPR